jgi:hypothetical protein
MRTLDELEKKLAREVANVAISGNIETALLKEFDRKWGRGFRPAAGLPPGVYLTAILALAAGLLLVIWPKSKPAQQPKPEVVHAIVPTPAPVIAVAVQAKPRSRRKRIKPTDTEPEFLRIPYTAPLAPYERAEIVRVEMPLAALWAAGFHIANSDAAARAQAELVIGEDGMAHALRLISISSN